MADYKVTAAQLASIANAIRLKGGISAALEYPSEWISAITNLSPASGGSEITPQDPTAEYKITDTELIAIANAIRTRGETSALLEFPSGFVSAIEAISGGSSVDLASWTTGTDAQIVSMIQAAHDGTINLHDDAGWNIGDVRSITIDTFTDSVGTVHEQQTIDIVISSFSDYMNCGCVMQFDFKDELQQGVRMNDLNTGNSGGWGNTEMKKVTLPALVNALPSWLKNLLIEFSILSSVGNRSSTITTVAGNKLALRSEVEVFGTHKNSASGEGAQIPYYTTYNNRYKKRGHSGTNNDWWLRSPYTGNYSHYCNVYCSGSSNSISYTAATTSYGISPFGCI